jgi:hypothetical protein
MVTRPLQTAVAALLGLAVLAAVPAAFAQPSPETRAAAAALWEDAKRLMAENKFAEACPKLEESQRIDPGMGTLYNLAVCYESLGRTASAWVGFRDVAGMASAAGSPDREKAALGKAAALEPRLMKMKVTVQPAAASAGVEVKRDGAVMSPALWGTAVPLDPGKHKVSASAPGKEPWEITVVLDQPGNTVTVDVPPPLDRKPSGAVAPPPPVAPDAGITPPVASPPPPVDGARARRPWQRPLGIVATVVGAVGLGAGTAVGITAKSSFDQSNQGGHCNAAGACDPTGLSLRSDAVNKGNIATGVFVAGAVLAAGGVVLWVTAPSARSTTGAWQAPRVGVGPGSVALGGSF